jgi:hypothetical protein
MTHRFISLPTIDAVRKTYAPILHLHVDFGGLAAASVELPVRRLVTGDIRTELP